MVAQVSSDFSLYMAKETPFDFEYENDVQGEKIDLNQRMVVVVCQEMMKMFKGKGINLDEELDDGEVLNELNEYGNAGNFYRNRRINCIDGCDLEFPCMIGKNFVANVRNAYVFVGSFTYVMDFVVLEDIGEVIIRNMSEVVIGMPFRAVTRLEYDCVKGLISFTRHFNTYIFRMPRTIPRLKDFSWSKVPPILVLSHLDLMSGLKYSHEKNTLMYKNCLNLGPGYQVDEDMK
ncbi:hypothetical protein Tco_0341298 [Tanacetum coccineum]